MIAVKPQSLCDVVEINDWVSFNALEREWNALVNRTDDEPFYRQEFFRAWIESFSSKAKLKILTQRTREGRLTAILPLVEERGAICWIPARQLISPSNDYSSRFDLIAENAGEAGRIFFSYLATHNSWDVLLFRHVPDEGKAWQLYRAAQAAGFPTASWEAQQSPYIALPVTFDELFNSLSSKFRNNLRRYRKRFESKGRVSTEHLTQGEALQQVLAECYEIEMRGWKGKNGTALLHNQQVYGFYHELAQYASSRGYLSLYLLKLNGRIVAFSYGLICRNSYYLILNSYDESFKDCAPGHLLLEEVAKYCISQGLTRLDFLGCALEWKLAWSALVRTHSWLFIFGNNFFGQALYQTKFKIIPTIKRIIGHWQ
ncbi:MAG: GNAT family N-acetyltransferase [Acidobacteriota bacterium]